MSTELATAANKTENSIVCYAPTMITTNGVWQGDNPLDYSLPLFILQLTLVVIVTRLLVFLLKPFRQPRVIAEILVLDDEAFATMVIGAVVMTGVITPIVTHIYRPTRRFVPYKRRTIQRSKPDSEFKVLVCVHTPRNVPTIINILEACNPTKKSPLCVYVLYLVELTGRASAMLIVHNTRKSGRPALNRTQAQSDHIINAFENFEQQTDCVSVQPLTAISPYSTMHEDICNLAEDKRVAFVIIPFHKQQTVDGGMESTNPAFRLVNQNVLANAPCSVGILVDRGFSGSTQSIVSGNKVTHHIAVLFFGGPDDREALAYAWRMLEQEGISFTLMRFIPGDLDVVEPTTKNPNVDDRRILTVETDNDRERHLDEEYVNAVRKKHSNDESFYYIERFVNNGEETLGAIRSMDINAYDLFIVGRGQGMISPLTAGLTDWSECPELGAIGDLLASLDFAATVSVLVVQQYIGLPQGDGLATPDTPGRDSGENFHNFEMMDNIMSPSRREPPVFRPSSMH
ncbi:hypothetical protein ACFE04_021244 [Oxalis oulophora]